MHIHITDPALVDNLVRFLERCECQPRETGKSRLDVSPPAESVDPHLARLQLDGYLRVWCSMHRGVEVTLSG